jgi:fatty acid/phospholipid biosynthesis enzyme
MEVYFFGLNGIVIKSHTGSTLGVFARRHQSSAKMALQELHSKIKRTIASAVNGAATSGGRYGVA